MSPVHALLSGPGAQPGTGENCAAGDSTVSRQHVCACLRIGQRRLQVLVKEGRLVLVGAGHSKRVTTSSFESQLVQKRNYEQGQLKPRTQPKTVRNFSIDHLDSSRMPEQTLVMLANIQEQRMGDLLSVTRAANALGISDLDEKVDNGWNRAVRGYRDSAAGQQRSVTALDARRNPVGSTAANDGSTMRATLNNHTNRSAELHRLLTQSGPQAVPTRAAPATAQAPAPRIESEAAKIRTVCKLANRPELASHYIAIGMSYAAVLKKLTPESGPQMLTRLAKLRVETRYR